LNILREKIPDGVFDLIYLDPPFNSQKPYNVLFKEGLQESPSQVRAFEDTWHWTSETKQSFDWLVQNSTAEVSNLMIALEKLLGHNDILAYLTMMTIRLLELHKVLKPTGSLYLHCDPTASHYLKIVMDVIFGKKNFRNEIVWCYTGPSAARKDFPRKHDIILRYSKTDEPVFNPDDVKVPYSESFLSRREYKEGKGGIYGGREEKGKDTEMYKEGKLVEDWWNDIPSGGQISRTELLGYPTQKPEKLLERIILASSDKGSWVLDPFCGCGTTVAVAERLKRNWVGIDITILAIHVIRDRLLRQFSSLNPEDLTIGGIPTDIASAKSFWKQNPYQFQLWACGLVNARPIDKKGADRGIDGVVIYVDAAKRKTIYKQGILQVKGGHVGVSQIRDLNGVLERERAEFALFVTLEKPTREMEKEAVLAGTFKDHIGNEFPKIQIMTVEELLGGKKPNLPSSVQSPYKQASKTELAEKLKLI